MKDGSEVIPYGAETQPPKIMKTDKICPKCFAEFGVKRLMELVSVVEWGKSEKFDKQFKCYFREGSYYCGLLLVQKGITD